MKNKKITVMAGTPTDTKMGADLLKENDFENIIEIAISKNPAEQTVFQISSDREEKIKIFIDKMKNEGSNTLFVYCNSLSGAIDFEKIEIEKDIKIVTPMKIYREIGIKYKKVGIICANAQGLAGIEKALFSKNENIEIIGFTLLEMVKEIENGTKKEEIAKKFNFDLLVNFFENLEVEAIIIGCTHFPYVKSEIKKRTKLEVIDPALEMIKKVSFEREKNE